MCAFQRKSGHILHLGNGEIRQRLGLLLITNDQWACPAFPLVSSSKTKPRQFSSVTSLCTRLRLAAVSEIKAMKCICMQAE